MSPRSPDNNGQRCEVLRLHHQVDLQDLAFEWLEQLPAADWDSTLQWLQMLPGTAPVWLLRTRRGGHTVGLALLARSGGRWPWGRWHLRSGGTPVAARPAQRLGRLLRIGLDQALQETLPGRVNHRWV